MEGDTPSEVPLSPDTERIANNLETTPKNQQTSEENESLKLDEKISTPTSPTLHNEDIDGVTSDKRASADLMNTFTPLPPKLPAMSSSESLLNLTPYSSGPHDNDEFGIYSDSEIGSQNSLELTESRGKVPDDGDVSPSRSPRRSKGNHRRSSSSPRRESIDSSTPSPKPRKRIRRRSLKSEGSEKSHPIGSGYSLAPATGKVFRNLLILEDNLREQAIQQKGLRRKYLTFMAILCSIIASISHHLYFSMSSAKGTIRVVLTFVLFTLVMTLLLFYLSGEYQKTIVLPRKFLASTNKGLRQLNVRLVKIKIPLTDKLSDSIREFLLFIITSILTILHRFDPNAKNNKNSKVEVFLVSCELQCQPRVGIADVKLVLNARVFSTDIREGWELYRSEFWISEGVRRRNNIMSFVTGNSEESILDKERLLKRDKKERKDRKKTSSGLPPSANINEKNLRELTSKLAAES